MADNKNYYYLKIKENFYDSEEMIILQSMPDGYLYSDILMKLYLRSLKAEGRLMFKERIPYNPTVLAKVVRHSVGVVEKALKTFEAYGLIEILDNGAIYMLDIENFIGQSSTEADRKRAKRLQIEKEKRAIKLLVDKCPTNVGQNSDKIIPELEIDIELEKEIEIDMSSEKEKSDKKPKEKDLCDSVESRQILDYDNIKSLFNNICKVMPNIKELTEKRRKVLKTLAKSQPDFNFEEYFKKVADTPFLNGHNKNGWVAGFDWIMKPDNITKVIEDTYKSNQNNQKIQQGKPIQSTNYEQREYDDEFFDGLYINKEYI
jgi:predicted phage replisome organizer